MTIFIAVIGRSGSGKTTVIENLIKSLSDEGYSIATAKHIHHTNFSIDTEGKDTWRHARAGAKRVVCVSQDEVAIIDKTSSIQKDFDRIVKLFNNNFDIVFLEGFHHKIADREDVAKIIVVKDLAEARQLMQNTSPPIIAVTGKVGEQDNLSLIDEIPIINLKTNLKRLAKIVKEARDSFQRS